MRTDPSKPFYMTSLVDNTDGITSTEWTNTFETEEEALDALRDSVTEYGGVEYAYKCEPIAVVRRPRVQIKRLKQKAP